MNPNYEYSLNKNISLKDQKMMNLTKAILSVIYRDYWATPEQKNIIIKKEKLDRIEDEKRKIEKYGTEINFSRQNKNIAQNNKNELIIYKENFFIKILKKIKAFIK